MEMSVCAYDGACLIVFPDCEEELVFGKQIKKVWLEEFESVGILIGDERVPVAFVIEDAEKRLPKWIVKEMNDFKEDYQVEFLNFTLRGRVDDGMGYLDFEKKDEWDYETSCSAESELVFDVSPEGRILGIEFLGSYSRFFYYYLKGEGEL